MHRAKLDTTPGHTQCKDEYVQDRSNDLRVSVAEGRAAMWFRRIWLLIVVVFLGQLYPATLAYASGFALRESSAGAMGTAYAGAAATNTDASDLFYNPASLSGARDSDVAINVTGLILQSSGTFSATTSAGTPAGGLATPHDFIGSALVPAMALRHRLSDRWAVGLSLSTPWGETTSYPSGWAGRYYALGSSLVAYNATPVVSYQVSPNLTLAVGAQIQYLRSHLTEAIDFGTIGAVNHIPGASPGTQDGSVDLHGHGWGAGYVLGVLWQPSGSLSLGLSYRSEVQQVLKGSERFAYDGAGIAATINALTGAFANSSGKTHLTTPAVVTAGARWTLADDWTALAGIEYTNWSSLHQLFIQPTNPANPSALTVLNWKNTWFSSLGLEYRPDAMWTLRAGAAYDEAAAPSAHLEPRIPDSNRYWLSAGIGYHWSDAADINVAVSHLFTPRTAIAQSANDPGNAARGSLNGHSNSNATLIGAQLVLH